MPLLQLGRECPMSTQGAHRVTRSSLISDRSCHGPAAQRLIGGAIGIGYMQIPSRVDYGLRCRPGARRGRARLSTHGDGDHCRYSCYADTYNVDRLHDPVLPPGETMSFFLRARRCRVCGVTLVRAFLYPARDRTGSKPHLSWRWRYGKRRIPPSVAIWQSELLAHDD
jgi:hypothetical protein